MEGNDLLSQLGIPLSIPQLNTSVCQADTIWIAYFFFTLSPTLGVNKIKWTTWLPCQN